jgi:hypothetical protein
MPIAISDLEKFTGWLLMVLSTESGLRYVGPITKSEQRANLTIVFTEWMIVDCSDERWYPATGASGRPMTCWFGNLEDRQNIQHRKDGRFVVNHAPAKQTLSFFPPDHPFSVKCIAAHEALLPQTV